MDGSGARLNSFVGLVLPQVLRIQEATAGYLREQAPEIGARVGAAYGCYETLLVFPTGLRFGRPYYPYNLPFYEASDELETSTILAFSGEYKAAIQHLRSVLELAVLGLHFCSPADEEEVKGWLLGAKTPQIKALLKEQRHQPRVRTLGDALGRDLASALYDVYDALSGYVHTRGQVVTSSHMRGSNFPRLNPLALRNWAALLADVVRTVALLMIARFPQALQGVPLFEKVGFARTPASGWLEPFEVPGLMAPFSPRELETLQRFSDAHYAEEFPIDRSKLDGAPNLTLSQLRASANEWWEIVRKADQGYIPGRTWEVRWATPGGEETAEPTTSREFLQIAAHARRQLTVSDEIMLAHGYSQNLLDTSN